MTDQIEYSLYSCEQIRQIEQDAEHILQLNASLLMERAGTEAFTFIMKRYDVSQVAIFCGSGNNAGDGYVLARLLHEAGVTVTIYPAKYLSELPPVAREAANLAYDAGVLFQEIDDPLDFSIELVIDALLGIGIQGAPRGLIQAAIHQINDSALPVVSLDVPSGLNADTGKAAGVCVKADVTITFIGLKTGLYTLDGPDHCGEIHCAFLSLQTCLQAVTPKALLLQNPGLPMPPRKKNTHKRDFGHVLLIGGGVGMAGAVVLAAKACLRTGAGLVSIATLPEHANGTLTALIPEALVYGIETPDDLQPLLEKASVCIVGPGLGDNTWAKWLYTKAVASRLPMVVDASALRWLAVFKQQDDNWVLTPHPGEAAALLDSSTEAILQDRYASVAALQAEYGGVIVLKGCGTLIKNLDGSVHVCAKGNPGMATAGMGDVLAGMIGALIAQGYDLSEATKTAVFVHAYAADRVAARWGERGLLASDLADCLPAILNGKII